MRVGLIACANGLGHVKRVVRIANTLLDRLEIDGLTLFCDGWQVKELGGWPELARLTGRREATVVPVSMRLRWSPRADDYGAWLLEGAREMDGWGLECFDLVLSDNLVEALEHSDRVVLSGSFLWHDVLATAFPESSVVSEYRAQCEALLAARPTPMLVNRYLAMPATRRETAATEVGFISFSPEVAERKAPPRRALIALGGARMAESLRPQLAGAVVALRRLGVELLAPPPWDTALGPGVTRVDEWKLEEADLAIVRGGVGSISDCVASRVPMLLVDDPNPEFRHNQWRLREMGIGGPVEEVDTEAGSPILREYGAVVERLGALRTGGEEQVMDYLRTRLESRWPG